MRSASFDVLFRHFEALLDGATKLFNAASIPLPVSTKHVRLVIDNALGDALPAQVPRSVGSVAGVSNWAHQKSLVGENC